MSGRRVGIWIAVTTLAYAVGATLSVTVVGAVARPVAPVLAGMVFVAVFGAAFGLGVGAVQVAALPRGAVSLPAWIFASSLGAAAGFVVAAPIGEALGNLIDPTGNIVIGGGMIQITTGAALGLGIGIAQARVLRGVVGTSRRWITASAVGVGLGWGAAAAVLELLEVAILKANLIPVFGAIVGLAAGITQAIVFWRDRTSTRVTHRASGSARPSATNENG